MQTIDHNHIVRLYGVVLDAAQGPIIAFFVASGFLKRNTGKLFAWLACT